MRNKVKRGAKRLIADDRQRFFVSLDVYDMLDGGFPDNRRGVDWTFDDFRRTVCALSRMGRGQPWPVYEK